MKVRSMLIGASVAVSLAVLATGAAISAQDKYTVKVPNGHDQPCHCPLAQSPAP
jgi:hypothetical protein